MTRETEEVEPESFQSHLASLERHVAGGWLGTARWEAEEIAKLQTSSRTEKRRLAACLRWIAAADAYERRFGRHSALRRYGRKTHLSIRRINADLALAGVPSSLDKVEEANPDFFKDCLMVVRFRVWAALFSQKPRLEFLRNRVSRLQASA